MIRTKRELRFFIIADMIMNYGTTNNSVLTRLKRVIMSDFRGAFLKHMRCVDYWCNRTSLKAKLFRTWHLFWFNRYSLKCGFSIAPSVFGYGLVIPHCGTIVVGGGCKSGNYAVLHTSICITANEKKIGNNFYVSTGAKFIAPIVIGDNVMIASNSVVGKGSNGVHDCLLAGMPAMNKGERVAWWKTSPVFKERVCMVESLKGKYNIQ